MQSTILEGSGVPHFMESDPTGELVTENPIERYIFPGAKLNRAVRCSAYSHSVIKGDYKINALVSRQSTLEEYVHHGRVCSEHGVSCCGHLQVDSRSGALCLPATMVGGTTDNMSNYERHRRRLTGGRISELQYRFEMRNFMMGKKGAVRSVGRGCIEGSLKMVISIGTSGREGEIEVPSFVASTMLVPDTSSDRVIYRHLRNNDWGLLVRQPCLWSGGIQPVRVRITNPKPIEVDGGSWDFNCSMKLPPGMCTQYGADFDGDEMTFFPITRRESINECIRFSWDYTTAHIEEAYKEICPLSYRSNHRTFHRMSLCTTTSWSDGNRFLKVLKAHRIIGIKVGTLSNYKSIGMEVNEFVKSGIAFMSSGAMKSSEQSDIGAISRRCKLGADTIQIQPSSLPMIFADETWSLVCPNLIRESLAIDPLPWFGNPAIRAISKLTSGIMQSTLKVKSLEGGSKNLSPVLCLLCGGREYLQVIESTKVDGTTVTRVESSNFKSARNWRGVVTKCNLRAISYCPVSSRSRALEKFVEIAVLDSGRRFDRAEVVSLKILCSFLLTRVESPEQGIQMESLRKYGYLRYLVHMNTCYFNLRDIPAGTHRMFPVTMYERLFISNFSTLKSISSR